MSLSQNNISLPDNFRSGVVGFTGRPNAGKSTFLNYVCGEKVAVVSDKPQTTRSQIRGIVNRRQDDDSANAQIVFVDTPGIHKPVSALGRSLNKVALNTIEDVDISCLFVDASAPYGKGDMFVAEKMDKKKSIVILNKIDKAKPHQIEAQLLALGELDFSAYFPVSAKTGKGVETFLNHLVELLPVGPPFYEEDIIMDLPEAFWVAELVREQLFRHLSEEMPYSIATKVVEWDWPRVRCEIYVERKSQKGMVIGKGGRVLKEVGKKVRMQMPKGAYLELFVKVDKNWQNKPRTVGRLGYGEAF